MTFVGLIVCLDVVKVNDLCSGRVVYLELCGLFFVSDGVGMTDLGNCRGSLNKRVVVLKKNIQKH